MCSLIWGKDKEKEYNPDIKIFRYMTIWKALEENVGVYLFHRKVKTSFLNKYKGQNSSKNIDLIFKVSFQGKRQKLMDF